MHLLPYFLIKAISYLQDRHWTRHVKYWSGNMLGISFSISQENFSFKTYINKQCVSKLLIHSFRVKCITIIYLFIMPLRQQSKIQAYKTHKIMHDKTYKVVVV